MVFVRAVSRAKQGEGLGGEVKNSVSRLKPLPELHKLCLRQPVGTDV